MGGARSEATVPAAARALEEGRLTLRQPSKPEAEGLRGAGTARPLTGMIEEEVVAAAVTTPPPALSADAATLPGVHATGAALWSRPRPLRSWPRPLWPCGLAAT